MADSYLVLYRKYRPASFSEVVGQEHIVGVLTNAVISGNIAHSYMFSGPRGTGKTTVARILAKSANCENHKKNGEPCNKCGVCESFSAGNAIDLIEIDAASNRGIDEIRELKEAVRFAPHSAGKKVYIIDEVHMLTREAFNALLKTLEEPPAHVIFILATTDPGKVPDTIRSRAQHFEFRRISVPVIERQLKMIAEKEKLNIESEVPHMIALLSEGSLRDAEGKLEQVIGAGDNITAVATAELFGLPKAGLVARFVGSLFSENPKEAFDAIKKCLNQGVDPKMLNKMAIEDLRHALMLSINSTYKSEIEENLSPEHIIFLEKLAGDNGYNNIEKALIELLESYHSLYTSVLPQIPLEIAIINIISKHNGEL